MNVSSIFLTATTAAVVFAAIGCTSTPPATEVATAPRVVPAAPPEQVVAADTMPSHPALQNERTTEVAIVDTPQPVMAAPASDFTERAPKADRN